MEIKIRGKIFVLLVCFMVFMTMTMGKEVVVYGEDTQISTDISGGMAISYSEEHLKKYFKDKPAGTAEHVFVYDNMWYGINDDLKTVTLLCSTTPTYSNGFKLPAKVKDSRDTANPEKEYIVSSLGAESGKFFIQFFGQETNTFDTPAMFIGLEGLDTLDISNMTGLKRLYGHTFWFSDMKGVKLPENLEMIGDGNFHGCSNLKEVTIPANTKVIEEAVFNFCESLEKIDLSKVKEIRIDKEALHGVKPDIAVILPKAPSGNGVRISTDVFENSGLYYDGEKRVPDPNVIKARYYGWETSKKAPDYLKELQKRHNNSVYIGKPVIEVNDSDGIIYDTVNHTIKVSMYSAKKDGNGIEIQTFEEPFDLYVDGEKIKEFVSGDNDYNLTNLSEGVHELKAVNRGGISSEEVTLEVKKGGEIVSPPVTPPTIPIVVEKPIKETEITKQKTANTQEKTKERSATETGKTKDTIKTGDNIRLLKILVCTCLGALVGAVIIGRLLKKLKK